MPNGNGAGSLDDSTAWDQLREDAFFPVCEEPLKLSDGRILDSHRAILHADDRKVLSVVSGGYRQGADGGEPKRRSGGYQLITNEAAVEAGKEVFAMVFGRGAEEGLRPLNLTMPKTRSFVLADFTAPKLDALLVTDADEYWSPFLRVLNSYNRTCKLEFTVGVIRKICANGMIGEDGFTYSDAHSRSLDAWLEDVRKNPLTEYGLQRFNPERTKNRLKTLLTVEVSRDDFLAGVAKALGLNPPAKLDPGAASEAEQKRIAVHWSKVGTHLQKLVQRYQADLGDNAYALLGAASEYASRQRAPGMHAGRVNALQRRCGQLAATMESTTKLALQPKEKKAAERIENAMRLAPPRDGAG